MVVFMFIISCIFLLALMLVSFKCVSLSEKVKGNINTQNSLHPKSKKSFKIIGMIICLVLFVSFCTVGGIYTYSEYTYNQATSNLVYGNYDLARTQYQSIGSYRDSFYVANACTHHEIMKLMFDGRRAEGINLMRDNATYYTGDHGYSYMAHSLYGGYVDEFLDGKWYDAIGTVLEFDRWDYETTYWVIYYTPNDEFPEFGITPVIKIIDDNTIEIEGKTYIKTKYDEKAVEKAAEGTEDTEETLEVPFEENEENKEYPESDEETPDTEIKEM